jgi:hypothetical protein
MRIDRILALGALSLLSIMTACEDSGAGSSVFGASGSGGKNTGGQSSGGSGGSDAGAGGSDAGSSGSGGGPAGAGGSVIIGGSGGSGPVNGVCPTVLNDDHDGDGWTEEQGDCNDCDPNVNPGAIDIVNYAKNSDGSQGDPLPADKQVDEDCDGKATQPNEPTSCDAGLDVVVKDPFDAARAMGLCSVKVDEASKKWGVISATLSDIAATFGGPIKAQGKALEHAFGILPGFGTTSPPREGERLFAISSGIARAPGQPGWGEANVCSYSKNYTSGYPPGFPKQGTCGTTGAPNDGVALDLKIRVPTNAKSLKFNFRFFSCEYPQYTCSVFNDVFAVLMSPSPLPNGDPMADKDNVLANIAFEATANGAKNVIGVNNEGFFTACEPGAVSGNYSNCKPGNGAQLQGSGFEGHGASAWLTTQVPVPSGKVIFLRFAIWDSSDGILDSSAIVDNFEWSAEGGTGVVTKIDPDIN